MSTRITRVNVSERSLPELKQWIAKELGVTEKYIVLMTPRGSQVKAQFWADESEIFVFDREFLSKRSSKATTASAVSADLPSLSQPPDNSSITARTNLKSHLAHLKLRAEWARSAASQATEIQSRIEALNNEIIVLQKSAKIALVNLGNVSRSLQRAFTDTEILASKKLQARKDSLTRIPSGVALLDTIKVHPVFGKEEETLGEFFDKTEISRAREICGKTHEEVEKRITELKVTMEEFIDQGEGLKNEVLSWKPGSVQEGGYAREITLISNKIERDFNHISSMHESPAAVSSSLRSFQNHTREYIPNIQAATSALLNNLKAAAELRQSVSVQSQSYLQRLSSAQERMVSIGPQLAEADDLFGDSHESYEILRDVQNLAEGYGEGLLEGFRRGLWKVRGAKRLQRAREEIALWRAQEQEARKAWEDFNSEGGVIWSFVDELSGDDVESASPISNSDGDGDGEALVTRKDIEMYISSLSKTSLFEKVAASLKERLSVLVMSIQSPQTDVATSPLRLQSSDDTPFLKTREGSDVYEQLLRDKTTAEERARNYESRVRNLEEMLHRQFRTPPRNFSPLPTGSGPSSPRMHMDGFDDTYLGRSVLRTNSPDIAVLQKRVQELEREKQEMYDRFTETEGTKSDLMANLEEQTKLFQAEREDLVRKANDLEREVERCETEISRFEEQVPKMETEMDSLRKGRQTLLREMNLLQTESGEKIKELEEAVSTAKAKVTALEHAGENAAAETERITGELRKASSAADNAHKELEIVRRLSDEHKSEHQRLEQLEKELQSTKETAAINESKKAASDAETAATLTALREELATLREGLAEALGLEKRHWDTESLMQAARQKLTMNDQSIAESNSTIASLNKETKSLSTQLSKSKALCASRTLKARDLTQRLYTQHTRCKQLLDTLGLQIKSSNGSPLIRYGSDKSEFLEPNDLELLYWMESGDSDEEADKYSRYLGRIVIDLDAFSQSITTRVRDAEKYAKKWQKEARAYREKSKRATAEAENKIAYRQFKEGDLALFLPTNNGRPWAAFNVNAPHFFLHENEAHRLGGGRDWLLARITKVEERTVDLASHPSGPAAVEHNPFDLADGLRWFYLDAIEEKPSTLASRELARSISLQKSESKSTEKNGGDRSSSRKRMSQSTPVLIPGREDGGVSVASLIREEGEE